MIVRCSNCNSAFAVNDDKVENKKFAFNCPKCANENVIDNRVEVPRTAAASSLKSAAGAAVKDDDYSSVGSADSFDTGDFDLPRESADTGSGAADDAGVPTDDSLTDDLLSSDAAMDDSLLSSEESSPLADSVMDDISFDDLSLDDIDGLEGEDKKIESSEEDILSGIEDLPDISEDEISAAEIAAAESVVSDDFSLDDIDSLDTDETSLTDKSTDKEPVSDSDIEIDMDLNLDIDSIELSTANEAETASSIEEDDGDLLKDDILFDDISHDVSAKPVVDEMEPETLSDLDIDLNEESSGDSESGKDSLALDIIDDFEPIEEEILTDDASLNQEDESITIDLDTLDIDLVEVEDPDNVFNNEAQPVSEINDDDITLDLDTLDIDLEEEPVVRKGEIPDDSFMSDGFTENNDIPVSDDDDITLNLDELDIPLEESVEIKTGETPEDDDRLTLEDAGLTLDEISAVSETMYDGDDDDDIKLSIDDIDPTLNVDNINEELEDDELKLSIDDIDPDLSVDNLASDTYDGDLDNLDEQLGDLDVILAEASEDTMEPLLSEEPHDLPDIDIDRYFDESEEADIPGSGAMSQAALTPAAVGARSAARRKRDDILDEDLSDIANDEIQDADAPQISRMVSFTPRGNVNFGIDFSLRFSRLKALLRLTFLMSLWIIPHFVVIFIYSVLSMILGFLNQLIILFAGRIVEDFTAVQENTLRYTLYIESLMMGAVDDLPVFAGRENIDHPLQMSAVYPIRNSRFIAFLRLTGIGIFAAMIPHILILTLISIALPLVFFGGQIMVLATARMPHILFDLMNRYFRYFARSMAFMTGITDAYPSFRFD